MEELKNYNKRKLERILSTSVVLTTLIYGTVAFAAASIFGDHVQADVLINLNSTSLAHILPAALATLCSYLLWLTYAFVLVFSFPVVNWIVREMVSDLILGYPKPTGAAFHLLTYGILAVSYCFSLYVSSIDVVLGFVGGFEGAVGVGLVPAMLAYKREPGWGRGKLLAALYAAMAALFLWHQVVGYGWKLLFHNPIYCQ